MKSLKNKIKIPVLRILRQEDHSQLSQPVLHNQFQASLSYSVRLWQHTYTIQIKSIFHSVFAEYMICVRHSAREVQIMT